MSKRKLIALILAIIIPVMLLVALYFVPLSKNIDLKIHGGVFITAEGQYGRVVEEVELEISGHKIEYLFQEDQLQLFIKTNSSNWRFSFDTSTFSTDDPYSNASFITIPCEISTSRATYQGYFAIDFEKGYFIAGCLIDPNKFLIGCTDYFTDKETILNHFSDWISYYFAQSET